MRPVVLAVVLCAVMSPVAYAGDQAVSDFEIGRFIADIWEAMSAIPILVIERVTNDTSNNDSSKASSSIEPPESDAGPEIIIHG